MSFFRHQATLINGKKQNLNDLEGNVLLVVNIASAGKRAKKQLKELEHIHKDYRTEMFLVLGFPCDQFKGDEPKTSKEYYQALSGLGISFPLFAKTPVKGAKAHPLFKWLKKRKRGLFGNEIRSDFTKFLIDRDGNVVKRFGPRKSFERMRVDIAKVL